MNGMLLLLLVTFLYAGYNLLVKQSSLVAEAVDASTIKATITLQFVALVCSLIFYVVLRLSGGSQFSLPVSAYVWAAMAGFCIGVAEIGYFYLFRGSTVGDAMPVSVATPVIVAGTIVIAMIAASFLFAESIGMRQWLGAGLIVAGVLLVASYPV